MSTKPSKSSDNFTAPSRSQLSNLNYGTQTTDSNISLYFFVNTLHRKHPDPIQRDVFKVMWFKVSFGSKQMLSLSLSKQIKVTA
jgi:hypothetical protein